MVLAIDGSRWLRKIVEVWNQFSGIKFPVLPNEGGIGFQEHS